MSESESGRMSPKSHRLVYTVMEDFFRSVFSDMGDRIEFDQEEAVADARMFLDVFEDAGFPRPHVDVLSEAAASDARALHEISQLTPQDFLDGTV